MSLLSQVNKGRKIVPLCTLLYGVEGIGKTTFGANAPRAVIVGGEDNNEANAHHFKITPDRDERGNIILGSAWVKFNTFLHELLTTPHDYKSLVVDTIDSLEPMVWDYLLKNSDEKNPNRALGGYGALYKESRREFTEMRDNLLVPLREKGMNIILLAHSVKTKFEDPITNTAYDTYEMKLHKDANPIFTEWVSSILFANFVNYQTKDKDDNKKYVVGTGDRRIFTEKRPSHNAKNRYNLPYEMKLDWKEFSDAVRSFYLGTDMSEAIETTKEEFQTSGPAQVQLKEQQIELPTEQVESGNINLIKQSLTEQLSNIKEKTLKEKLEVAMKRAGDDEGKLAWVQNKINTYFNK